MLSTFETDFKYGNEPIEPFCLYNLCIISYRNWEGCNRKVEREWPGLRFELMMKYQWYFRYIAAQMQIQQPRRIFGFEVYRLKSSEEVNLIEKKRLVDKIRSANAKITQAENELAKLRASWNEIFSLEEHPKWEATQRKLTEKQTQLAMMQRQLEDWGK